MIWRVGDKLFTNCGGCAMPVELDPEATQAICSNCKYENGYNMKGEIWTEAQEAIMQAFYKPRTHGIVQTVFEKLEGKKSKAAIVCKAHIMGLSRKHDLERPEKPEFSSEPKPEKPERAGKEMEKPERAGKEMEKPERAGNASFIIGDSFRIDVSIMITRVKTT